MMRKGTILGEIGVQATGRGFSATHVTSIIRFHDGVRSSTLGQLGL
jgi:hypothetical protein